VKRRPRRRVSLVIFFSCDIVILGANVDVVFLGGFVALDEMTPKEMTQQSMQVQQQTLASTARTKQIVEQTIEVSLSLKTFLA
jgi:hypothetical protein